MLKGIAWAGALTAVGAIAPAANAALTAPEALESILSASATTQGASSPVAVDWTASGSFSDSVSTTEFSGLVDQALISANQSGALENGLLTVDGGASASGVHLGAALGGDSFSSFELEFSAVAGATFAFDYELFTSDIGSGLASAGWVLSLDGSEIASQSLSGDQSVAARFEAELSQPGTYLLVFTADASVNADELVGGSGAAASTFSVSTAAIPSPGSAALAGLAALGAMRRRR